MADYENHEPPEGINVSSVHPLKEFALLLGGLSLVIVVAVFVLSFLSGYLVRFIPFAQEKALVSRIDTDWLEAKQSAQDAQRESYLQGLADRLAAVMDLPQGMQITVHYAAQDTVNAVAILGGNVVVFQGLIDKVASENALAMVVAHEIAHVRQRHPIIAMGRGFTVMFALSVLSGMGDGLVQQWAGSMGMLPVLAFSREQEEAADAEAVQAIHRVYGHVGGAASFFEHIASRPGWMTTPALLNSHPGVEGRIARIQSFDQGQGSTATHPLVELPEFMKDPRSKVEKE